MPRSLAAWLLHTRRLVVSRGRRAGLEYRPLDPGRQRTGGTRLNGPNPNHPLVHRRDQRPGRGARVRPATDRFSPKRNE